MPTVINLSDVELTPAEEKAVTSIIRHMVTARKREYTGDLAVKLSFNQGGVTGKKFVQEWAEK